jgi:Ca2+-binding RTX toxin-like protein
MPTEIRVNTYEANWQDNPSVLTFRDGSSVIMWRSFNFDLDTYYIGGQRFDRYGNAIGGEFLVDGVTGSASEVSNITLLKDGGFVVTFAFSPDGILDQDQVYAKIYNADFTVRKDSFRVDTIPDFQSINANAAALDNGGFIVFYDSDEARTTQDDIYAQRYDRNGNKIGTNFLLNTRERDFDQNVAEVAQLKNGNALVLWHSEATISDNTYDGQNEFRATLFSKTGAIIKSDFHVGIAQGGAGDGIDPFNICALNNGGFAIVRYETENPKGNDFTYDVKLKLYNSFGAATSPEITVHAATRGIIYSMDVTQLATGEIVVAWQTPEHFYPSDEIQGRIYDASGRPLTGRFVIAAHDDFASEDIDLKALPTGGFVVTYMSEFVDSDHDGIGAKFYGIATAGNDVTHVDVTGLLYGLAGNDRLIGNGSRNTLNGGSGNDALYGLGGNDYLVGSTGSDQFIFSTTLNATKNVDRICDFNHGSDDIVLSDTVFKKLGPSVAASELRFGIKALDANDYLVYNKATGALSYDSNGSASGGMTQFATLKAGTVLSFDDFAII